MLAELGADAGKEYSKAERLGDVVVGARLQPEDRVGFGILSRKHDLAVTKATVLKD
jgi:hypothetical protein